MSHYDLSRFKNVTVALNTPFTATGDIDLKAAKQLTRYYINKGVKSLYVCGSTGEGFLLDETERKQVTQAVTEEAAGEMAIIVHVGSPSTRHACDLAKHAQSVGADATSAVPSVYYRLGEESVYTHWTHITEASELPFFIYNIPQLTGFNLSMPLFNRMIQNDRVAGIKNSSEAAHDIIRFKEGAKKDFIVFNGPDEQYLAGRLMGADAGIGGTYGAMPELYLRLETYIREGQIDKAYTLQNTITQFIYRLCSFPSLYGACKTIIRMNGCNIGEPRLPFLPVDEKDPEIIRLFNDIAAEISKGE